VITRRYPEHHPSLDCLTPSPITPSLLPWLVSPIDSMPNMLNLNYKVSAITIGKATSSLFSFPASASTMVSAKSSAVPGLPGVSRVLVQLSKPALTPYS
jgi:hypothetical protein